MTGEVEAVADIATGALVARAVEGGGTSHHVHAAQCLNCGTALIDRHCHACGQAAHVHRSLGAIGHELAHGILHFEGKVWRTLPLLVFRPGELTRRYIQGERMRFVSPLALFLFSVFVMFAVISVIGGEIDPPGIDLQQRQAAVQEMAERLATASSSLDRLDAERADAVAAGRPTDAVDREREALRVSIKALTDAGDRMKRRASPIATDVKTGWPRLDKGIAKANANPGLIVYKLQSSAYKFSWALIPLSVPFVALLFLWRRGHRFYDHAMFVTYSLSFMTLLVTAITISEVAGLHEDVVGLAAVLIPPLHMYKQLRSTYRLRRFSALWRTAFLLGFSFITLLFFILMLLGMGLVG